MKTFLVFALAVIASASSAQAQRMSNMTGEQVAKLCMGKDPRQVEGCTAYINGVADAAELFQQLRPADGSQGKPFPGYACVPPKATGIQLRQAFVDWLRKHPDRAKLPAGHAVLVALDESYPCGQRT